jgi:hypothetical protein
MKIQYVLVSASLLGVALETASMQGLNAQAKPPAYVITEIDVTDAEAFREYAPRVQPSFAPFGGRYLVGGGDTRSLAGEAPTRIVVVLRSGLKCRGFGCNVRRPHKDGTHRQCSLIDACMGNQSNSSATLTSQWVVV